MACAAHIEVWNGRCRGRLNGCVAIRAAEACGLDVGLVAVGKRLGDAGICFGTEIEKDHRTQGDNNSKAQNPFHAGCQFVHFGVSDAVMARTA